MKTQIDHGIFDYCGAQVVTSQLLLESEIEDPAAHLQVAHALGRDLYQQEVGAV
ncbi:putative NADPH-quinone reductase [Pseudomonas laurylsulfativorans]|nr:putative NADPH-quinone reductase [Pseudomonas laurylsulfativorans]